MRGGEGEVRDRQLSGLSCVPGSADFDYCESGCSERESNWAESNWASESIGRVACARASARADAKPLFSFLVSS